MTFKYIRIVSDLHLEAYRGRNIETLAIDFLSKDSRDEESVLVLAGDISSAPDQLLSFISEVEDRFLKVIFIPGNHCYYHHDYDAWNQTMDDRFTEYLSNTEWSNGGVGYLEIDSVRFIFSTMWGDGGRTLQEQAQVGYGLNDFRIIKKSGIRFTVNDMQKIHKGQKAEIDRLLKVPYEGKSVVITHHMPSYRLCHPRFGNEINGGFAANCEDILAYDHAPDLWVGGHSHDSADTILWKTRYVANPLGYPQEFDEFREKSKFNSFKDGPKFISISEI
jgi:hypothetical protein